MLYEGEFPRQIYMDGRGHPKDPNPTWLGHSVGRWEGDTLVVDTVGFNGRSGWACRACRPARCSISRSGTRGRIWGTWWLRSLSTIQAPTVKPWKVKKVSALAQDYELMEFICNEGERDLQHIPK